MKEITLRDILTSYERKREQSERQLEERKKKVYSRIPEIKEIDDEIGSIGLKLAKLVLLNPSDKDKILEETKTRMNDLKLKKEMILADNKVPKGYLNLKFDCVLCKDTGFLSNGHKCNCLKQKIVNEAYNMSNLSRVLHNQNFSTFDASIFSQERDESAGMSPQENILEILSICEGFVMDFDKDNGENMLFYGDTGLGKSFMCNCVAKELLDKGYLVIYQTAFKMFEIIEDYKFKSTHDHITKDNYSNLFDCDLLIIDDLGTELTNSFTNSELFNILNTRLLSGKKTIISTNLSPIQLGDIYAIRIFSRIFDRFRMVKFIGNDLRWEQKMTK
ncbi:DNA replication protein DnaC [[Clostridium] sordellii]|uniref:ATP-binding protein n=1 Tax=Paraclostridium sordellii TaxID=1505 RepID=UPI0005E5E555|nr:ATP-binding protein [Paeniclostridium sordellii]CEQ25400.1 DNA replication protein DnaC [[Clostridium] sordellii] [Paeniclostridium sordellii]